MLQSLHEISLELSTLADTDALCRRAVEWALENLGFDRVSLWFLDPEDRQWSRGTWGTDESGALRDERTARVLKDELVTPEAFYQGKIAVLLARDAPCFDNHRREVGRADKAMAPLWDAKTIIGELAVDCFLTHRTIQEPELDALVLYARIVGHMYSLLRTRELLAQVSEERGTLLKELKHRTRNSLSVIAGLVALESHRSTGSEAKGKLSALEDRVEALAALYALLDRDEEPGVLRLDEYLRTVALRLAEAHGADARGVRFELDLTPVSLDAHRASSLGIAVNELLTDALKHAFPGGRPGTVWLTLAREGEGVRLEVRDDGPGLPAGFDSERSDGLGLGLVAAIARQIRGSFEWGFRAGAVFTLRFRA